MKKIVIVGANSYIARNLIYMLKTNSDYCLKLYDYAENHADGEDNYAQINILSKESLASIDMDCDVIFMFVGKTGSANGFDDTDTFIDINQKSLLNVLNEYRAQKSKAKIVFPSTRLVYKGAQGKLAETADKEFKTIYAMSKYACEQFLEQYRNVFDIPYCVFRICVPYGTLISGASSYGTAEFMLGKAKKGENITLYGDGSMRRTLTYIGDLCNIMIKGALSEKCVNDVYNIGGEDYSLKEMAQLIADKYSTGVEYVQWPLAALKTESGDTVFDDEKLNAVLDVEYKTKFRQWIENNN